MKIYTLYVQGWGDSEDEYYPFGTFMRKKQADDKLEEMLKQWEKDGFDRAQVEHYIEEHELQG